MRITLIGKGVLFLIFLVLWNAVNGGLNTLYMMYGALAGAVCVSWLGVRIAELFVRAGCFVPAQIFCDETVPLKIEIRNTGIFPMSGIAIRSRWGRIPVGFIGPRGKKEVTISYRFLKRGLNDITDVNIEFSFPFGIFVKSRAIPMRNVLVFPALIQVSGRPKSPDLMSEEIAVPRRGVGDEFWGVRDFSEGDDARLINWKLSAKLGRPLIKEYAEIIGNRVVVRVSNSPDDDKTEKRIIEAASVARYFIDEGAHVRLVTDEGDTGFGRGLLHLGIILKHLALLGAGGRPKTTGRAPREKKKLPAIPETGIIHLTTYILSATIAASFWLVAGLDLPTQIAMTLVVPAAWMLDRKGKHPIPASFFNVMNIAVLAAVLFADIPFAGLLPGLTHLLAYVLANRLLCKKSSRDTGAIFMALFLLFLLVSWQTVEMSYFAAFVIFFSVFGFLLTAISEDAQQFSLRGTACAIAPVIALFAVAGVAFAVTPRVQDSRFAKAMRRIGLANIVAPELSIVNLADSMDLGSFGDVRTNTRRALQLKIAGFSAEEGATLRIRAGALDHFDGKRWTRTKENFAYRFMGMRAMSDRGEGFYEKKGELFVSDAYDPNGRGLAEEFFIYPMATSVIFSVGDPTALGGVSDPSFDLSGAVYSAYTHGSGARYIVYSQSDAIRTNDGVENYEQILGSVFLELPDMPAMDIVKSEAARITRGSQGNKTKAEVLQRHFHDNFTYSYLDKSRWQTLENFLVKTKSANCEYFSTAMTLMLRAVGVPARVAIGYLAKDWQKVGGYFDVRNSDGHAWVEVYLPNRGWAAFDPTPSVIGAPGIVFPLGRIFYVYFLGAQMSWYRYVIGYDFYVQQDALAGMVAKWRDVVAYAAAVLAIVLFLAFAILFARLRFARAGSAMAAHPASIAYLKAEKILKAYGFVRRPSQSPLEILSEVGKMWPDITFATDIAEAYYEWRFGGKETGTMGHLISKLKSALKRRAETHFSHQ